LAIKFVSGAESKGITKKKAEEIFSLIEKFAQYGFNKSHSTAYAYVAYQTAWLKVHHPAEFMSANLTSEMGSIDRIVVLINECKKMGIEVRPPDINVSFDDFRPIDNKTISYGLNAIKNVGTKALETIIKERVENGLFKTIFDICSRVEQQKVNKRVLESLVVSGSLDGLEGNRAQNLDAVDNAIKYGQKMHQENDKNQVDLFGIGDAKDQLIKTPVLGNIEEWSEKESLSREMEVLGLYVSGHPLLEHADDLEEFTTVSFEEGQELSKKDTVFVGGMITKIVRRYDRRNREMAFFDMDCLGGHAEIVVFSDCYRSYGNLIDDGNVVFVKGKPSETSDFSDLKILSDEIISVENVRDRLSQRLNIKFPSGEVDPDDIDELMNFSKSNPGNCKLLFHLPNADSPRPLKVLAHNVSVSTDGLFVKKLRARYGKDNVWID
jgi:DNA polymerase-3 subunit alpha